MSAWSASAVVVLAAAISRLYLGAHWLSYVLVSGPVDTMWRVLLPPCVSGGNA
jgi:hypothetical protein